MVVFSGGGDDPSDALELGGGARDGDSSGVVEAELLLRLPEQLREQRMVEVNDGHGVPPPGRRAIPFAPDVHRQVPSRRRSKPRSFAIRLALSSRRLRERPPPPAGGSCSSRVAEAQAAGEEEAAPAKELGSPRELEKVGLSVRLEADVASGTPAGTAAGDAAPQPGEPPPHPESSEPLHERIDLIKGKKKHNEEH